MIKIHREGRLIVAVTLIILFALVALSALFLPHYAEYFVSALSLLVLIMVLRFFRVPYRRPYLEDTTVTSPADGRVVAIEQIQQDEYLGAEVVQISVFMSIHDVHINYFPVSGKVEYVRYHPGRYLVARHPKSSSMNERVSIGIMTPRGPVMVRQIAGTVARRIRCYASEGGTAQQGSEMGFIRFGSRLDLFLPPDAEIKVELNQKVTGAVTPVARIE